METRLREGKLWPEEGWTPLRYSLPWHTTWVNQVRDKT